LVRNDWSAEIQVYGTIGAANLTASSMMEDFPKLLVAMAEKLLFN